MTYWVLRKYDIFQINSCTLVNVRGAQTFNENPLARQSAGAVEVRERGREAHRERGGGEREGRERWGEEHTGTHARKRQLSTVKTGPGGCLQQCSDAEVSWC